MQVIAYSYSKRNHCTSEKKFMASLMHSFFPPSQVQRALCNTIWSQFDIEYILYLCCGCCSSPLLTQNIVYVDSVYRLGQWYCTIWLIYINCRCCSPLLNGTPLVWYSSRLSVSYFKPQSCTSLKLRPKTCPYLHLKEELILHIKVCVLYVCEIKLCKTFKLLSDVT